MIPCTMMAGCFSLQVFVDYFSNSVSEELKYKKSKVMVQSVLPFHVETNMITQFIRRSEADQFHLPQILMKHVSVKNAAIQALKILARAQYSLFRLTCVDADYYVNSALDTVGFESRTFGCFAHAVQGLMFEVVPRPLLKMGVWLRVKNMVASQDAEPEQENGGSARVAPLS